MYWMRNNGKRIGLLAFPLAIALLVSGCTYVDEKREAAKAQADLILEAIKNNDPDGLVALFSEYATNSCDLYTEAEELLEFIHGNIVSVGEVRESRYSGSVTNDGTGYDEYRMNIEEIRTDTSGEYVISYDYFVGEYSEHQRNGVNNIWVGDRSAYTIGEGYAELGMREMGIK